jgi:FixJ family two-component response regulator
MSRRSSRLQSKVFRLPTSTLVAVVDDDAAVLASLDSLVRSLGFSVAVFSSAEAFLSAADMSNIGCLITDVQMPKMSGVELHEWLMAQNMRIPTIFITAFPEETVRKRAMVGSAVCFLSKPFQVSLLIDCLNRALS